MPISLKYVLTIAAVLSVIAPAGLAQPYLYVSNQQGSISIVNPATNAMVSSLSISGFPAGVAADAAGQYLYVALMQSNAVAVIETGRPGSPAIVARIAAGRGPVQVAVADAAGFVYAANQYSNNVSVINASSRKVVATIPVGKSPAGIAVTPDGARVLVANTMSSSISVISVSTNKVTATWPALSGSTSVAVSPDGSRAYVANQYANAVTVHDAVSGKILSTIAVPNYPNSVAVSPGGNQVYVTSGNAGTLSVINTASGKVVSRVVVGPLPTSVTLSSDGALAYVTNMYGQSIPVVSTASNTLTGNIPNTGYPLGIAVGHTAMPIQPPPPSAQPCTLTDQSGCPPDNNNPHLATFLADLNNNLEAIDSSIAGQPRSQITNSALLLPAALEWMSAGTTMGTSINAYMDSLASAGIRDQEVQMWLGPLSAATQYAPSHGQTLVPSDCANSSGVIPQSPPYVYLPLNGKPNKGSGRYCVALSQYDSMFAHAAATGVKLRIMGFKPSSDMLHACGSLHKPTEAQYENCMLPMAVAAAKRWKGRFNAWQVMGEPMAGLAGALGEALSVADVDTFIVHMASALHAVNPALTFGAAASALSYCSPAGSTCALAQTDIKYWNDWISGAASPWLKYLVLDIFAANCDLSNYYYAKELEQVTAHFMVPALAAGKTVQIGQAQHPVYCPAGHSASEAAAYASYGDGDDFWLTSTVQDTWAKTFHDWASASGASIFTVYCSAPFVWYSSNPARTLCTGAQGNYTADVISHLPSVTSSGLAFGAMNR
jgi:YVTN family beta-propeller protein